MAQIILNEKGQKMVVIDEIIFSSKRKIDWDGVVISPAYPYYF